MDYPHGYPHGRDRREEDYPPPGRPHPAPFYEESPPPPPFHGGNPPPPPFYGEDPPPPPFHGVNPPPPPYYEGNAPQPPYYRENAPPPYRPPQVGHVHHSSHTGGAPPPPSYYGENEPLPHRPPEVSHVHHTSHIGGEDYPPPPPIVSHQTEDNPHHHRHHPHLPSFIHPHDHHSSEFSNKPSVRVYSKAETNYSLTIRNGKVILAPSDPSDPFQHWVKDEKYSTRVKDEEGFPSFALINKATGQAMKHSIGATHPVQLIHYNPDGFDESILWTESRDLGDGYRTIRMVNNIRLNVDAFNGDKNHGGVHDGTTIVLWEWKKGENQRWKIVHYCKSLNMI